MARSTSRRNFLTYSTMAALGICIDPLSGASSEEKENVGKYEAIPFKPKHGQRIVTVLQTTDVHSQLHPHDELFWENNKIVFRTVGGYAHLATLFKEIKANNPNTFIVDTGDMFQGSQLSVETTGKALQPILNSLDYNLYLPGNWEVVFKKSAMQ